MNSTSKTSWVTFCSGKMADILKIVGNINILCGQDAKFLDVARGVHMLNSGHLTDGTCKTHHC